MDVLKQRFLRSSLLTVALPGTSLNIVFLLSTEHSCFSVGLPPTTHHHGPVQRRCDHCKDRGSHWCSVSTECGQGVVVIELLEKVKTNEHEAKELCKSIANTVTVINSWHIVGRIGEERAEYFACICSEMEQCLIDIEEQLNDEKRKCRGFKKILTVNDFHDAIETYRRHVEDLKTDFLISITGECLLKLSNNCIIM
ncbi:uncharacterized protein ARMOST_17117 [Armillaria ostoyae]|uniref:Uncharacterized protein n=1 Tax=Armillaria ostoyae TaxID=47428 RepID=A0A284RY44_ARMOS|nr:uncharacterized protein ARMOST_17117 [Armillaria ostoyae]